MVNKAFIFDMDGVLLNSEEAWIPYQHSFSTNLFGEKIYKKIGSTVGLSIDAIYQNAARHGFSMGIDKYYQIYDKQAALIYADAQPTKDLKKLIEFLKEKQFKLGLVSSSRRVWIDIALTKLDMNNAFDLILSVNDDKDIKSKPYPDGYITAMNKLEVVPDNTIVLEDSNAGIESSLSSGAYTIAYREHLLPGYIQKEADAKANNIYEVIEVVNSIF
jgi:HAD superfamily hydrolase (TIGR01509 family)